MAASGHARRALASEQRRPRKRPLRNGRINRHEPVAVGSDTFRYDPMQPVPSRGGPVCCTGNPADREGPVDQLDVESREDVLVFTSEPLVRPLRIAGPLHATLTVSSSALDTDFVARLVDVWPDGRAIGIQEGALRARYRQGSTALPCSSPESPCNCRSTCAPLATLCWKDTACAST